MFSIETVCRCPLVGMVAQVDRGKRAPQAVRFTSSPFHYSFVGIKHASIKSRIFEEIRKDREHREDRPNRNQIFSTASPPQQILLWCWLPRLTVPCMRCSIRQVDVYLRAFRDADGCVRHQLLAENTYSEYFEVFLCVHYCCSVGPGSQLTEILFFASFQLLYLAGNLEYDARLADVGSSPSFLRELFMAVGVVGKCQAWVRKFHTMEQDCAKGTNICLLYVLCSETPACFGQTLSLGHWQHLAPS